MSKNWPYFLALLLPLAVLASIAYFRPFWGIMDDGTNVFLVQDLQREGFLPVWQRFISMDLYQNGRFRLLYIPMVALLYAPAGSNSLITYTLNTLLLSGIFAFIAYALWPTAREALGFRRQDRFGLLFFLLAFAFPWTTYALISPSVQEKIVLLFASLVVFVQYHCRAFALWFVAIACTLFLALNTKEQIALFFPLFLAVQWQLDSRDKNYSRLATLLALLLFGAGAIHWAGQHGDYKAQYGLATLLRTLHHSRSVYLFLLLAGLAECVAIADFRLHRSWPRLAVASSYPLGLLLFVALLAPWGLGNYINCAATVFFVVSLLLVFRFARDHWFPGLDIRFAIALAFLLALPTLAQTAKGFSAYGDLRALLNSNELKSLAARGQTVWMPCMEGAGTLPKYMNWLHSLELKTALPSGNQGREPGEFWLVSRDRCSNGEDFASLTVVLPPQFSGGFTLLRRN